MLQLFRSFSWKSVLTLGAMLLAVQFFAPEMVFAVADPAQDGGLTSDMLKGVAQVLSVLVNIFTFLSLTILNYGSALLGVDFITGTDAMNAIRPMWIIVRNITNIAFVLILLFLAFSNLFSSLAGEGGNWTIKDKLPKVIVALVAINFSLLGFKVVVDAVHVGTYAILDLASSTLEQKGAFELSSLMNTSYDENFEVCDPVTSDPATCTPLYVDINDAFCDGVGGIIGNGQSDMEAIQDYANRNDCLFVFNPNSWNVPNTTNNQDATNIFLAFGVVFQHLERMPLLAAELESWTGVLDSVIFSGILSLAFIVALVAILIVLLVRVVVLWLAMVFSPLLIAAWVMGFGNMLGSAGDTLVNVLVIPLKIAAAFAVTFVMMASMVDIRPESSMTAEGEPFLLVGDAVGQLAVDEFALLWQIATIVIFWMAAFWAITGTGIGAIDNLVGQIQTAAQSVAGYAARSVTVDQPIIPIGEGEKASLTTLGRMPQILEQVRAQNLGKERTQLASLLGQDTKVAESQNKLAESLKHLGDGQKTTAQLLNTMRAEGLRGFQGSEENARAAWNKLRPEDQKRFGMDENTFVSTLASTTYEAQKKVFDNLNLRQNEIPNEAPEGVGSGTDTETKIELTGAEGTGAEENIEIAANKSGKTVEFKRYKGKVEKEGGGTSTFELPIYDSGNIGDADKEVKMEQFIGSLNTTIAGESLLEEYLGAEENFEKLLSDINLTGEKDKLQFTGGKIAPKDGYKFNDKGELETE